MKITDMLSRESISLGESLPDKAAVIHRLVELQQAGGALRDGVRYERDILAREDQGSTAVEGGVAVPHAKSQGVARPGLAALTLTRGVDCGQPGGGESDVFFMIAAPEDGGDIHLEILSRLMTWLMQPDFTAALRQAGSPREFLAVIDRFEEESGAASTAGNAPILAVTACPTGIAHTYMAAEALRQAGDRLKVTVKVETNGSGGVKNQLTAEEIQNCKGIIVAADKKVDTGRFQGHPVLFCTAADGIHRAEELIRQVQDGGVPVYEGDGENAPIEQTGDSRGRRVYKHLMNGVSHMLPFVIGGGILIALAFLLDDYAIDPDSFGMNTPAAAFFKIVGSAAFGFMLPVLAGYIAYSIADRPGLAVGFVGGYLANEGISFVSISGGEAVSAGFLGALAAGFLAGYLVVGLRKLTRRMPESLEGLRPTLIYPLLGILGIGLTMCLINPVAAFLNEALITGLNAMGGASRVLLGLVLGGMMSVDMGGPVNKAAYVFGTAAIASGSFDIMAAVMVGGMVPPIAIALCATIFPRKFSREERKSGLVNYVLGLCFITEGAIPFAAADPWRVLPACIAGSSVAGGLSMLFGCTLRAPHGGIFVFPVVGGWPLYLAALAVGSAVGCGLLAVLKRNVSEG